MQLNFYFFIRWKKLLSCSLALFEVKFHQEKDLTKITARSFSVQRVTYARGEGIGYGVPTVS